MDEKHVAQLLAEFKTGIEGALVLIVSAIASTTDAELLHARLESRMIAAEKMKEVTPLALSLSRFALAAAKAEALHQGQSPESH